eukprot:gene8362-biopygen21143
MEAAAAAGWAVVAALCVCVGVKARRICPQSSALDLEGACVLPEWHGMFCSKKAGIRSHRRTKDDGKRKSKYVVTRLASKACTGWGVRLIAILSGVPGCLGWPVMRALSGVPGCLGWPAKRAQSVMSG